MILELDSVSKSFGAVDAVVEVSMRIPAGRICGLLGPNGAGKTTLIRMVMDIFRPDSGSIRLADNVSGDRKNHIGYLPEERGLYQDVKVRETLVYFAQLKGLSRAAADANVDHFLARMELTATANTRIGKLSKGNQQKVQFIAAVVHRPRLLILDEPFSGLDPINAELVSRLIRELRDGGISIVLSTHQMGLAEAFCEQIVLLNRGQVILAGELDDIIRSRSGVFLIIDGDGELAPTDLFAVESTTATRHKVALAEGASVRQLLAWLAEQQFETRSVTPFRVPLAQIFIHEVQAHGDHHG